MDHGSVPGPDDRPRLEPLEARILLSADPSQPAAGASAFIGPTFPGQTIPIDRDRYDSHVGPRAAKPPELLAGRQGPAAMIPTSQTEDAAGAGAAGIDPGAAGGIDHFVWSPFASPQTVDVPFEVTVTAVGAGGQTVGDFTGPADLVGLSMGVSQSVRIGDGAIEWESPLRTYWHDARTQVIYLAEEIGGAGRITSLSLDVAAGPPQALNDWTIRMRHTPLDSYGDTPEWASSGWTTVYQGDEAIAGGGWADFLLSVPFDYNGVDNLMVDFSFDNASYTNDGLCYATQTGTNRTLHYFTDSGFGEPLSWAGPSDPAGELSTLIVNVELELAGEPVLVAPQQAGPFVDGVWKGLVVVREEADEVLLRLDDGEGHLGDSVLFDVGALRPVRVELPESLWESAGAVPDAGAVAIDEPLPFDLTVSLASSDEAELLVPPTVEIPSGLLSASFDVTAVDDALEDGSKTVTVTATPAAATLEAGEAAIRVRDDEVHQFAFDPVGAMQVVGRPFEVTVRAEDAGGETVELFEGAVDLAAVGGSHGSATVVVSELDTADEDWAEFTNVSGVSVDISGWQITWYDWRSYPLPQGTFTVPPGTLSEPGQTFMLREDGASPGTYPDFYTGTNISWHNDQVDNQIALLVRDAAGRTVDFVCAVDADPGAIDEPTEIPPDQWQGDPIAGNGDETLTYQRVGDADGNAAGDWAVGPASEGEVNDGLALPFAGGAALAMTPPRTGEFAAGVWAGQVELLEEGWGVRLRADDGAAHVGFSDPFDVGTPGQITGRKWHDVDGDGVWDPSEHPLAGWRIYVDLDGGGKWEPGEPFDLTDESGAYVLSDLAPGSYIVQEQAQEGWEQTYPVGPPAGLFYVWEWRAGSLYTVDAAGKVTDLPAAGGSLSISGLGYDTADEILYGSSSGGELWQFDLTTGAARPLGSLPTGIGSGLTYSPLDDRLYSVSSTGRLVRIDPEELTAEVVSSIGPGTGASAVAYDPLDGRIYVQSNLKPRMYSYDAATYAGPELHIEPDSTPHYGMTFAWGSLVMGPGAVSESERTLHTYDPATGRTAPLLPPGVLGGRGLNAMAFVDAPDDQTTGQLVEVSSGQLVGGVDFGNRRPPGEIRGVKWLDADGDGAVGADEPPLADWRIYLDLDVDGQWDADEPFGLTDAAGEYLIAAEPGSYTVAEQLQVGWEQTLPGGAGTRAVTIDDVGQVVGGIDFGNRMLPVAVGGVKWDDLDGSGVRDAGEPGVEGWRIFADLDEDGLWQAGEPFAHTDGDGAYVLELLPGQYVIAEEPRGDWLQSYPDKEAGGTHTVTLLPGGGVEGIRFGNWQPLPNVISGVKYHDLDGDGVRDAGELGIEGWRVYLDLDADGAWQEESEPVAVTDLEGRYTFDGLLPGEYVVAEFVEPGWVQTYPGGDGRHVVFVWSGDWEMDNDFGNWQPPPSEIHGLKWSDLNRNGLRDPGEPGLEGWQIYLDLNENSRWDDGEPTRLTGPDGRYAFTGLLPGTYVVAEVLQDGWRQTFPAGAASAAQPPQAPAGAVTTSASTVPMYLPADVTVSDAQAVPPPTAESAPLINMDLFRADPRFAGIDGRGLAVAILDTGVDLDHPFFGPDADGDGVADRIVYSWDFADNDADAGDANGHGSNVTSIAASQDAVYGGMAPAADIIHLKVFSDTGSGNFGYLEQALQWLVDNAEAYNVAAVNMSLGDGGSYDIPVGLHGIDDELAALAAMDVIVVASAGNGFYEHDSQQGLGYPGADPNALSAGAVWDADIGGPFHWSSGAIDFTTAPDRIASFSQRHEAMLDIFAPGARIRGAEPTGGVIEYSGTSQAAPHITGIVALCRQLAGEVLGRRLTQAELRDLLSATGVVINDGDDENDNVDNTHLDFPRVDMLALGEAILAMGGLSRAHTFALGPGAVVEGIDFGNYAGAEIRGTKWFDADRDGIREAGEPPLEGWWIYADLDGSGGWEPGEPYDVTGPDGRYVLQIAAPDSLAVREVLQDGWARTYPPEGAHLLDAGVGEVFEGLDFGNSGGGRIEGSKWFDADGDGQWDADEPPLAGWRIYADLNGNGLWEPDEPNAVTGEDGGYALEDLLPGSYLIAEQLRSGWEQTFPGGAGSGSLIGVDFDQPAGAAPDNWASFAGGAGKTLTNLTDEAGLPTPIDLAISSSGGSMGTYAVDVAPSTLPGHDAPLTGLDGYVYESGGAVWTFAWSDLTPSAEYGVYVFGLRAFNGENHVTITGAGGTVEFDQLLVPDELAVNAERGDSGRALSSYVVPATADAAGRIVVEVTAAAGASAAALGGLAIQPSSTTHRVTVEPGQVVEGVHFGNYAEPMIVRGTKWADLNGNGQRDEGEPPLAGWLIHGGEPAGGDGLDGTGAASAVTDANGEYELEILPPYSPWTLITEQPQPGWRQTYPAGGAHVIPGIPGRTVEGADFGNEPTDPAEIRGTKWDDLDADGLREAGEPPLAGWRIFVDLDQDGVWQSDEPFDLTEADGSYAIRIMPGTFTVAEELRADWQQSYPGGVHVLAVGAGEVVTGADFGNWRPRQGQIKGTKWNDRNADGVRGPGEEGLAGWRIFADLNADGAWQDGEPSAVTDANGRYVLDGLTPGTYTVVEQPQGDWRQTYPPLGFGGGSAVTVPAGLEDAEGDFENGYPFNLEPFGHTGMRYQQIHSAGEFGEGGTIYEIRFRLDGGAEAFSATGLDVQIGLAHAATTVSTVSATFAENIGGGYVTVYDGLLDLSGAGGGDPQAFDVVIDVADLFDYDPAAGDLLMDIRVRNAVTIDQLDATGLPQSDRVVRVYAADDLAAPIGSVGANEEGQPYGLVTQFALASDRSRVHVVELASGQVGGGIDFGNWLPPRGEIRGVAWNDLNADGARDAGEGGLTGWRVYADLNGNGWWEAGEPFDLTGADGSYRIGGLGAGSYEIAQTLRGGWEQTFPPVGGGQASALVFQDALPWSKNTLVDELLLNGVETNVVGSGEMLGADLADYSVVFIPSDQPQTFYDNYALFSSRFDDYVAGGGLLWFAAAAWGWNGGDASAVILPGGATIGHALENDNTVLLPEHPLMAGVPDPIHGDYVSHAVFGDLPPGAAVVAAGPGGLPTLVEYGFGDGLVLAFGQTLEYGGDAGLVLTNGVPYAVGRSPGQGAHRVEVLAGQLVEGVNFGSAGPDEPPTVVDVRVRGRTWRASVLDYLAAADLGIGGYSVPAGGAQLDPLPWESIDEIRIAFSEDVSVARGDLAIDGINVAQWPIAAFEYDPATFVATWRLVSLITADTLSLRLADSIEDATGNALDGEWTDGVGSYPSGDGDGGGEFVFALRVLPGDVDQDGDVGILDKLAAAVRDGARAGDAGYSVFADLNADGAISAFDKLIVSWHFGDSLGQDWLLSGDTNADRRVDYEDYLAVRGNIGTQAGATLLEGDFDGDGDVDALDYLALKRNYGRSAGEADASVDPPTAAAAGDDGSAAADESAPTPPSIAVAADDLLAVAALSPAGATSDEQAASPPAEPAEPAGVLKFDRPAEATETERQPIDVRPAAGTTVPARGEATGEGADDVPLLAADELIDILALPALLAE